MTQPRIGNCRWRSIWTSHFRSLKWAHESTTDLAKKKDCSITGNWEKYSGFWFMAMLMKNLPTNSMNQSGESHLNMSVVFGALRLTFADKKSTLRGWPSQKRAQHNYYIYWIRELSKWLSKFCWDMQVHLLCQMSKASDDVITSECWGSKRTCSNY